MDVHRLDVHRLLTAEGGGNYVGGNMGRCREMLRCVLLSPPPLPLPPLLPPPPAAFPGTASNRERTLMLGQRARGPTVLLAMAALVRILVPGGLLPVRPGPGDPGGPTRRAFIVPSPRITGWKGGRERASERGMGRLREHVSGSTEEGGRSERASG